MGNNAFLERYVKCFSNHLSKDVQRALDKGVLEETFSNVYKLYQNDGPALFSF